MKKPNPEKPTLVLTVGLPYSGKSTWAEAQGVPVVNPDSIRLALHGNRYVADAEPYVWAIAKTMVKALFLAGHTVVILDATNNTRKRREQWQSGEWHTAYKTFNAVVDLCIDRAKAADDAYILPVIERMWKDQEPITIGEFISKWPESQTYEPKAFEGKYGQIITTGKQLHRGEPVFILRATDPLAPASVEEYAVRCYDCKCEDEHVQAANKRAQVMREWQAKNPDLVKKLPD